MSLIQIQKRTLFEVASRQTESQKKIESEVGHSKLKGIDIKELPQQPTSSENFSQIRMAKTSASSSSFKCPQTCAKKANLVRHIKQLHKEHANVAKQVQTGRCLCLECNQSFRRIVELRDHLLINHSFSFRTEILEFENRRGMCYKSLELRSIKACTLSYDFLYKICIFLLPVLINPYSFSTMSKKRYEIFKSWIRNVMAR